eukprot:jgi/Ulvmu1/4885/UM020_0171.1
MREEAADVITLQGIQAEINDWAIYGSRADVGSAINDYSKLLSRNRSCEENVGRLEGINVKLRQEKADLVYEISEIKQEAHQEIIKAEARLKSRIRALESENGSLSHNLDELQKTHGSVQENYDEAKATIARHIAKIYQLEAQVDDIERDKSDLRDALTGEKEARVAAVEELEARLEAKERAEEEKEEAEAQFRELKLRYIERAESLAKAQDDANAEFAKFQEMQRLFNLEKSAWEEQHYGGKRAFNPAASFNLGSVVGSVRNVLRSAAAFQQPQPRGASMDEPAMPDHAAGVIAVPDMDILYSHPPVAPIPVRSAAN